MRNAANSTGGNTAPAGECVPDMVSGATSVPMTQCAGLAPTTCVSPCHWEQKEPTPADIFAQMDTNLDQQVDLNELLTFVVSSFPPTMPEAERAAEKTKTEGRFAESDTDQSGGLDLSELAAAIERYSKEDQANAGSQGHADAEEFFKAQDLDGNKFVTLQEVETWMQTNITDDAERA